MACGKKGCGTTKKAASKATAKKAPAKKKKAQHPFYKAVGHSRISPVGIFSRCNVSAAFPFLKLKKLFSFLTEILTFGSFKFYCF